MSFTELSIFRFAKNIISISSQLALFEALSKKKTTFLRMNIKSYHSLQKYFFFDWDSLIWDRIPCQNLLIFWWPTGLRSILYHCAQKNISLKLDLASDLNFFGGNKKYVLSQ